MLFNTKLNKIRNATDCFTCEHFNQKTKKCMGLGKCCFEYDKTTGTIIDPVSHLPININKIKQGEEK